MNNTILSCLFFCFIRPYLDHVKNKIKDYSPYVRLYKQACLGPPGGNEGFYNTKRE